MATGLKAQCEERAKIVPEIKRMSELIAKEDRDFTAEERTAWDRLNGDYDTRSESIDKLRKVGEAQAEYVNRLAELEAEQEERAGDSDVGRENTDAHGKAKPPLESRAKVFEDAFAKFADSLGNDGAAAHAYGNWPARMVEARSSEEYREAFGNRMTPDYGTAFTRFLKGGYRSIGPNEARALQVDLDVSGGYLAAGEQFVAQLIKAIDDLVFMRGFGTIFSVPTAESLGVPSLDTDISDATWTGEITAPSEDSDMAFGKRNLFPHPLSKLIKVSRTLLRKSVLGAEALVRDRLAYKFSIVEESAFLTGSGANQPLGVYTASSDGISTARDVSTDNTTTAVTADGLINAFYSLKPPYMSVAQWIFHRTLIRDIRKLKDGEGNYLWQPGITADKPDLILGRPFVMSEFSPNTMTTGLYVGIVGDFSHYWIAEALNLEIQRLDELYAATNQVGFIGRREVDGMPVLEEAFARVTLA